ELRVRRTRDRPSRAGLREPVRGGRQVTGETGAPSVLRGLAGDFEVFRATYHPGRSWRAAALAFALQPCSSALILFRPAASERRVLSLLVRRRLIPRFGCDVERGAIFAAGLLIAHPVGIVVGGGVRTGRGVKLHHHVSLGTNRGGCPTIEDGAYIFAGAV